jgi:carbon storage regulator
MLSLTRKVGQRLLIGNEVILVVTDVGYAGVRISIETKTRLPIYRGELFEAMVEENRRAARTPTPDEIAALDDAWRRGANER